MVAYLATSLQCNSSCPICLVTSLSPIPMANMNCRVIVDCYGPVQQSSLPLVACWPGSPTVSLVAPPTSLDALVPSPWYIPRSPSSFLSPSRSHGPCHPIHCLHRHPFTFSPMSPWFNANGDSIWPSLVVTFFEEDMLKCWLLFRGWK